MTVFKHLGLDLLPLSSIRVDLVLGLFFMKMKKPKGNSKLLNNKKSLKLGQSLPKDKSPVNEIAMVNEKESEHEMDTSESDSDGDNLLEEQDVNEGEDFVDATEGPRDQGGFTILGEFKPKDKKQVSVNHSTSNKSDKMYSFVKIFCMM